MPEETFVLSMLADGLAPKFDALLKTPVKPLSRRRGYVRLVGQVRFATASPRTVGRASPLPDSLAAIGGRDDESFLRVIGASSKAVRPIASAISRRLAPAVYLWDLGPVRLEIGGVPLRQRLRRKVLGLLCFLASHPRPGSIPG